MGARETIERNVSLRDSLKADLRQPHVVFGTSTRGDPDRERHGAGERRGVRAPPTSRRPSGAPITRRERGGPGRGRDAGEGRGVRTPGRGAGSARWFVCSSFVRKRPPGPPRAWPLPRSGRPGDPNGTSRTAEPPPRPAPRPTRTCGVLSGEEARGGGRGVLTARGSVRERDIRAGGDHAALSRSPTTRTQTRHCDS